MTPWAAFAARRSGRGARARAIAGAIFALLATACGVCASPRLRETPLDVAALGFQRELPVDPSGAHGPKRVSGYFRLNRTEAAEMFYFFFESRNDPANDPIVLWLTGGPGCSSELAVFYENGPFRINPDLSLRDNPHGWDRNSNMLFIDQPIGTGFSYSESAADMVFNETGVALDMLDFLQEFFAAKPAFAGNKLFITGESYAGHYVPAVAHTIWQWNRAGVGRPINLRGLAIGNGLTDPAIQYGAYAPFALDNGLIDRAVYGQVQAAYPRCRKDILLCNHKGWEVMCKAALSYCQTAVYGQVLLAAGNVNVYDIRKECLGPLCYDFSLAAAYLAQDRVRAALGVGDRPWSACDVEVNAGFTGDWMLKYDGVLPALLHDGIQLVVYAGDKDLKCNWLGNRQWVDALPWSGAPDWDAAVDLDWAVDGKAAGRVRQVGPLTFVRIFNAGHMVSMDQPVAALDMLHRFTRDQPFLTSREVAAAESAARSRSPGRSAPRGAPGRPLPGSSWLADVLAAADRKGRELWARGARWLSGERVAADDQLL